MEGAASWLGRLSAALSKPKSGVSTKNARGGISICVASAQSTPRMRG